MRSPVDPVGGTIARGLRDLARGRTSSREALLVAAAPTRLRERGLVVPEAGLAADPELALYAALAEEGDPFYRYRALLAELDSFVAALERRRSRR